MRVRVFDAAASCAVAFALAVGAAAQQTQTIQPNTFPATEVSGPANSPASPGSMGMEEKLARQRNSDRQQKIVDDTARLLTLAQELKSEVEKSNKDQLSIDVVKKAEEIEKLAKTVKEKMRDGQ
ncbi:hypothetical protein [Silvibacterium sp.]|uniref:hypothetical protein n=1 Tax=Silvibacterium sp. TaxID=1964179 RepID=UPI0039E591ED